MQGFDSKTKALFLGGLFEIWDFMLYCGEALKVLTKVLCPQLYLPLAEDSATSQ